MKMSLLRIEEPAAELHAPWHAAHPLWRLGFRPFYLLAAAFAALSLPLWMAQYFGWLGAWPQVSLGWHMHEMVFGMALAVIVGFLFTAGRAWTNLPTPSGRQLAALAGLWLAGRLAMLLAPAWLAAGVDLLFVPLAAWPLYRVLQRAGNKRNLFLVALLGLLTLANATFHAADLGLLDLSPVRAIHAAILIIVVIEAVIGGRVIPMFTANGAPGSKPFVSVRRDRLALGLMAASSLAWVAGIQGWPMAALACAAAGMAAWRLLGWQPQRTVRVPLLWILHLSYAWIAIGFFMLALAALDLLTASAAFHALTVGSMAGLILGMMTRTALGHTGRALKAGPAETAIYVLIEGGAVARVAAGVGPAAIRNSALLVASICWSAAFLLYVAIYAPYLFRARVDGREG
jgi:uncharacterized protein involved in response to NO